MNVRFSVVGQVECVHIPDIKLDSVPRVDDSVYVPVIDRELCVRAVVWFPLGEVPKEDPFVYIVLGNPRPK